MKDIVLVIGNGFTIDLLRYLKEQNVKGIENIDVVNLFKHGENTSWPIDEMPGFLSSKHCPSLWTLGARSTLDVNTSNDIIENIITCANVIQGTKEPASSVYIKAYKELEYYLMALFIHYNQQINIEDVNIDIDNWGWYKYIKKAYTSENVKNVHIITFNYDIWLERILKSKEIQFDVVGFDDQDSKIKIYKPHGSISFQTIRQKEKFAYQISNDLSPSNNDISFLKVDYAIDAPLSFFNPIIPPAGESSRYKCPWAECIRNAIQTTIGRLSDTDQLIVSGLSYWHVDRLEIDSIFTSISSNIDIAIHVNPYPPKSLDAVLTTLFKNLINYSSSNNLEKINI